MRALLGSRLWFIGAVAGVTGWGMHVAALSHAPLSLVQAFVAGGLVLLAPVATVVLHQRMTSAEWLAVVTIVFGLVVLSIGLREPAGRVHVRGIALTAFMVCCLGVALVLLGGWASRWRAHALGLAGGILYGAGDTSIKALTLVASHRGIAHVLISPWLATAVVATVGAFFCFQRGLQTGRAVPVVVLMTGGTTVVSVAGGFAVFGDPIGHTPLLAALHVVAFVLVTIGSALLAPTTSVAPEDATVAEAPLGVPDLRATRARSDRADRSGRLSVGACEGRGLRLRPFEGEARLQRLRPLERFEPPLQLGRLVGRHR